MLSREEEKEEEKKKKCLQKKEKERGFFGVLVSREYILESDTREKRERNKD